MEFGGHPDMEPAYCVADIELADFIAVRLESSGTPGDATLTGSLLELEQHFQACLAGARARLPLRLGLCCGRWCSEAGHWELRAHDVDLWPGCCLEMTSDMLARRVSHAQVPPSPDATPASRKMASRWTAQLACSAQWVFAALHSARVPVVFHDGLLDMLWLFELFVGEAPSSHGEFGRAWIDVFPVVFDTAFIAAAAHALPKECLDVEPERRGEELHAGTPEMRKRPRGAAFKELGPYTHRAGSTKFGLRGGIGCTARAAMATAEAFLTHLGSCMEAEVAPPPRKRARVHGGPGSINLPAPYDVGDVLTRASMCLLSPASQGDAPCAKSPTGLEGFPVARLKRRRPAEDVVLGSSEVLGRMVSTLTSAFEGGPQQPPEGGPSCVSADVGAAGRLVCQRIHNRVLARGTSAGHMQLDAMLLVQLIRRLKKKTGSVQGMARALRGDTALEVDGLPAPSTPTPSKALPAHRAHALEATPPRLEACSSLRVAVC